MRGFDRWGSDIEGLGDWGPDVWESDVRRSDSRDIGSLRMHVLHRGRSFEAWPKQ